MRDKIDRSPTVRLYAWVIVNIFECVVKTCGQILSQRVGLSDDLLRLSFQAEFLYRVFDQCRVHLQIDWFRARHAHRVLHPLSDNRPIRSRRWRLGDQSGIARVAYGFRPAR